MEQSPPLRGRIPHRGGRTEGVSAVWGYVLRAAVAFRIKPGDSSQLLTGGGSLDGTRRGNWR